MKFLWAILIGLVLGVVQALITSRRRDPGTLIVRAIIGILSGVIVAIVIPILSPQATTDTDIWISAVGVIILLFLYWLIIGNRKKKIR